MKKKEVLRQKKHLNAEKGPSPYVIKKQKLAMTARVTKANDIFSQIDYPERDEMVFDRELDRRDWEYIQNQLLYLLP